MGANTFVLKRISDNSPELSILKPSFRRMPESTDLKTGGDSWQPEALDSGFRWSIEKATHHFNEGSLIDRPCHPY